MSRNLRFWKQWGYVDSPGISIRYLPDKTPPSAREAGGLISREELLTALEHEPEHGWLEMAGNAGGSLREEIMLKKRVLEILLAAPSRAPEPTHAEIVEALEVELERVLRRPKAEWDRGFGYAVKFVKALSGRAEGTEQK